MNRPPLKVLVAYSMWSTHSSTIMEYLSALERYTDFQVSYVHATHDAEMDFDFNEFDVVFQNHCIRLCFDGHASPPYQQALKGFKGLKVIAVQDDYDRTSKLHRSIRELGIHVVLTCIQRTFWPLVYPASELPGVALVQGLTGYVPEILNALRVSCLPLSDRKIVVGYRGRDLGARYGRLAFDKYEIGRQMIEICTERGISHDIAMDEASRIYGDDWYRFLGSCRVVLGSESGSNVFDFDGSIEDAHNRLTERFGRRPTYEEFLPYIADVEKCFDVGQISPRVFECAVMRTPMVLFRGRYSDVLEPDLHYVPLEKDFSNIEDVLRSIEDISALEAMADRTYKHLVLSGSYGYRQFATGLKIEIERQLELLRNRSEFPIVLAPTTPAKDTANSGDRSAPPSASSALLAERPTKEPQSLQDARRKQTRFQLEYFRRRFAEMQSFYANAVIACLREAQRIAAHHTGADVSHSDSSSLLAGIKAFSTKRRRRSTSSSLPRSAVPEPPWSSGLAQLVTLKEEVERELVSVTSQLDALRETRRAAEASDDQIGVDASFVRELDLLRQYFDVGPPLYQQFAETYEHTRQILIDSLQTGSGRKSKLKTRIDRSCG